MYLDVRWRTRQWRQRKLANVVFWKKKYTKYIGKKNPKIIIRSLPGFPEKSILGQWNLKRWGFDPSRAGTVGVPLRLPGAPVWGRKITKKPLRKVLRSCELLENLPFKQWFSYFFDSWVPEKSLQILISGIVVAKNDGNVHLDGSWINILIMLCDLGKNIVDCPSCNCKFTP